MRITLELSVLVRSSFYGRSQLNISSVLERTLEEFRSGCRPGGLQLLARLRAFWPLGSRSSSCLERCQTLTLELRFLHQQQLLVLIHNHHDFKDMSLSNCTASQHCVTFGVSVTCETVFNFLQRYGPSCRPVVHTGACSGLEERS